METNMSRLNKKSLIGFAIALVISSTVSIIMPTKTYAADCDTDFYSSNDILFYNPCEDGGGTQCTAAGSLTGPAPTSLSGSSNAEKVWNYFTGRGLTPVGAAGAMGNIEQESSFDPLVQEGGSGIGFGLIQWSFERRTKLEAAAAAAGVSFSPGASSDAALLFQLNWLWDGEYGSQQWQGPVNAETKVEGDPSKSFSEDNTGNGSAMVFHALVERSGDGATGKQERIDSAKKFLEQFGNAGSSTGSCSIGEGGLTNEQAQKIMTYYKDKETRASLREIPGFSFFANSGASCNNSNSPAGREDIIADLANCTAFSTYFVGKYTSLKADGWGDGKEKVTTLSGLNPGVATGTEPRVFSVFSERPTDGNPYGHTGVILGIANGNVIIGEAVCSDRIGVGGYNGIKVREASVESMTGNGYTYIYMSDYINKEALMGVVNG